MIIRMKDIAKMANVSVTTVSLVLNNKEMRISDEKKKEILDIAKQYNFQPNVTARGLAMKKTNMIGLVIPDIENPFFAQLAKAVDMTLRKNSYFTIFTNSNDNQKKEIELIEQLVNLGVDGLLISLSNQSYINKERTVSVLSTLNIPYVLMDRNLRGIDCSQVYFDNIAGGYMATRHLIELGHKNIGFIRAPRHIENANDRYLGYMKAMEENQVAVKKEWVAIGDYKITGGYKAGEKILKNRELTAVVSANDLMLMGLMRRAREQHITIPGDLSVVGYDHSNLFSDTSVILTSVDQNKVNLAVEAMKILKEQMRSSGKIEQKILKPEFFIGESSQSI